MGTVGPDEKERRQYRSGSVFQRKDGLWIGRFEAGVDREGKRRRITVSATTEPRCKERLEERKREIARDGVPEKLTSRPPTVKEWADDWLDIIVNDLRPKAFGTTRSAVKVWIVPTIGRKRLQSLKLADLRSIFNAQRSAGRKQATQIRTHSVLMSMFTDAVREGHYVPPEILHARKPRAGESDRIALPLEDTLAILKVASERPDASLWASLLLQGLRQNERLGLTWQCVDLEAEAIDISWQLQPLPYIDNKNKHLGFRVPDGYVSQHLYRRFHLVRPKSDTSRRVIPMTPWMTNALRVWRDIGPASPYGLVWPNADGLPVDSADDLAEWKRIQEAAGVAHPAGRYFYLHEARHATATLLIELGVPRDVIEAILGHSKFVESYDHANRLPMSRDAMTKLAERLALE